jgi:hypothetical protein
MLASTANRLWPALTRKLLASAVLISYLATATGLPLPILPDKDRSQPFPCQNHACGCQSAQDCWHHCCCFTPEEKRAWAREHGMEVPSYAEAGTPQGWNTVRLRDREQNQTKGQGNCASCEDRRTKVRTKCEQCACRHKGQSAPASAQLPKQAQKGSKIRVGLTVGLSALRCRGLSTQWVSTGGVVPSPACLTWTAYWPLVERLAYSNGSAFAVPSHPPDPPPRIIL